MTIKERFEEALRNYEYAPDFQGLKNLANLGKNLPYDVNAQYWVHVYERRVNDSHSVYVY